MAGTEENPIVYPELVMPENVECETVTVWSLGLALDADVYRPKGLSEGDKLPAVILSHGIGGDKLTASRYAAKFAESGMIAISFSQTSWGNSHGRMTVVGDLPEPDENGERTVKVKMAHEVMDPLDWVDCYRSAIDYISGDPNVDPARIGAWGTSFGGGTSVYAAAIDKRIKAVSVQVPALFNAPPEMEQIGAARAQQIARGVTPPIPDGPPDAMPNLRGTPNFARMAQYRIGDQAQHITVPTLIMDAANEELFDIRESGGKAYETIKANGVEAYYEVLPDIDHYGIYFGGFERGCELANDWFVKHL
ncbi:MAG: CocE/NonD family hydrolase [Pseudomonadota bacterium]